jgi:hypothetical protein
VYALILTVAQIVDASDYPTSATAFVAAVTLVVVVEIVFVFGLNPFRVHFLTHTFPVP